MFGAYDCIFVATCLRFYSRATSMADHGFARTAWFLIKHIKSIWIDVGIETVYDNNSVQ